jgi:Tetratricopeptide repeat
MEESMKKALIGLVLAFASAVAWALPSQQDIQNAISQGNYTQAQSQMAEVVAAKPESAKAHYVYAEILAHNGAFNKASEEAAKAKQIDPNLKFVDDPAKFRDFEALLQREQNAPQRASRPAQPTSYSAPAPAPASSSLGGGIPAWMWIAGLVIVGIFLARGLARSRAASAGVPPAGYGPSGAGMQGGYGPGYGPYGPGGVPVQGRSGLGTAAAVAGGVAGGMLLDEFLHRKDGSSGGAISDSYAADPAASQLENRSIDFGSGNDWDSGGGGGGGGGDSGGGGGGDWT